MPEAMGLATAALARSAVLAQAVSIGSAVVIAFLSGVMAFGDMPARADRIAAAFPLKPFNDAIHHQFDPFGSGAGWNLGALAVMAAWGDRHRVRGRLRCVGRRLPTGTSADGSSR